MKLPRKDVRQLLDGLKPLGWTWAPTGSGHVKLTAPNGDIVFVPSTPSDWRSMRNVRAQIRRVSALLP